MDFEDYKIIEGTITINDELATSFGCIGTLEGSSDIATVEKKCEGAVVKTVKKSTYNEKEMKQEKRMEGLYG